MLQKIRDNQLRNLNILPQSITHTLNPQFSILFLRKLEEEK